MPLSALKDVLPSYAPLDCEHNALAGSDPVTTVRLHFLDVVPGEAPYRGTVLCAHGEPTWGYLYRKLIDSFVSNGYRVVCMDHIGFGRSDKFGSIADYSHAMHVSTLVSGARHHAVARTLRAHTVTGTPVSRRGPLSSVASGRPRAACWPLLLTVARAPHVRQEWFVQHHDLKDVTLVCQDWGVPTAIGVVRRQTARFSRLVLMNGSVGKSKVALRSVLNFVEWRQYAKRMGPNLDVELVMGESSPGISRNELRAYSAPFPSAAFRAGAATWPLLAPLSPKFAAHEDMELSRAFLATWQKPCLLIFSEPGTCQQALAELIPGCLRPPIIIEGAGHFLQEPAGVEIAQHVVKFMETTSPDECAQVKLLKQG